MRESQQHRWREIERIFDETLDLPEPEWAAFLARACRGDEKLQREVISLLAAHGQANGFLASQAAPLSAKRMLRRAAAPTPQRIGPYRLLREIAQGGMSTVWLAERADTQYQQQVAIKLIRAGVNTPDIAQRLRHERQILADLNHPNIARLLDGGTTDSGQPYLVMEYIEGVPIDVHCRQQELALRERVRLFRQVCAAVEYAHQRLIIHRDLKPANILVANDGAPKLLDFGIAKVLQPDLTQSRQTQEGQRPMTPAYASPEQVRGETLATTSDVYSLGVVLYELLTGRSPYQLQANTYSEMMRAITEQEPECPSAVISQPTSAGQSRATDKADPAARPRSLPESPDKLRRHLQGDLDAIVLMALRKEPGVRYASVEQFSADIQRYLDGLPTLARKGTLAYRAAKYLRRHKVPAAAAALILLSLLGGISATSRQSRIARAEQARAEAQRVRAEQALTEVEAQRTRAANALTTAEQRRRQAEAARAEANQQRAAAETQRVAAEAASNVAQAQRRLADEQRQHAETQELSNRQLLYASRMGLAQQAWSDSNAGRTRELLDYYLPLAATDPDFRGFEWYYLWRLCHREVKTFTEAGSFDGLAYSPDGKVLVTQSVAVNGSSPNISEVTFRDAATWRILASQKYPHAGAMGMMAAGKAGLVAVGFSSDSIRIFSFSDYKERLRIGELRELRSLAISPSGELVAAGSYSGGIQLFDASSGKQIRALNGHQQQINTLAFSPDGETLVSGSFDHTVRLWDVKTGKEIHSFKKGNAIPGSVLFTPDGKAVIAASGGEMKIWGTAAGEEIATRRLGEGRPIAAISPDGKILATGDSQPVLRLWDTQTWQEITTIKGHGNQIRSLAFKPDGMRLASGSLDQSARIWELSRNEQETVTLADPERRANFSKAVFTSGGRKILSVSATIAGAAALSMALLWDGVSGRKLMELDAHTKPPNVSGVGIMLAGAPDGRIFATGGTDSLVKVWSVETGQVIRTFSGFPYFPTAIAFSPDSRLVAVGSSGMVGVYEVSTGRQVMYGEIKLSMVNAVVFLPDQKTLVTGGIDKLLRFWDIETGQETRSLLCGQKAVSSLAVSPDGKLLATGGLDSSVAIWEAQTGRRAFVLKGHSSNITSVSFSPDGKRLASGSADHTVKLWDLATGQELITYKDTNGFVGSVAFSPDGKQLLVACGRVARILLAATEDEVRANVR